MRLLFLLFLSGGYAASLPAQTSNSDDFNRLLANNQMVYFEPLEGKYKAGKLRKNALFNHQYLIRSRKKQIEIRYCIRSIQSDNPAHAIPHITSLNLANHLASNQSDAALAVHSLSDEVLSDIYQADWGASIYFQPKASFSEKQHCQMLSLFKEGIAQAYIFILFNEPGEEIDQQAYTLRFQEKEEVK